MSTDLMREQFEAWWASRPCRTRPVRRPNGDYNSQVARTAWDAWQASRAALVVELPEVDNPTAVESALLRKCRAAIEAAGVKVKP